MAFAPSFAFVLCGFRGFHALRGNTSARAFLDGAGPAAIGAIFGAFVPLAGGVDLAWQWAIAAIAGVLLFAVRLSVVATILMAAAAGALIALAGAPLP